MQEKPIAGLSIAFEYSTYPLPGELGLIIDPITLSVASVALNGSDSNH